MSISERNAIHTRGRSEGMQVRPNEPSFFSKRGHVIVASCHYFTIRPKEKALGELTKKAFSKREREKWKEKKRRKRLREKFYKPYKNNSHASKNRNKTKEQIRSIEQNVEAEIIILSVKSNDTCHSVKLKVLIRHWRVLVDILQ